MHSNKLNYTIAVALVTILLAGCAPGRNYRRPDLNVPAQYGATASADSSLALQSWKEFFRDETLSQLIDRAMTNNFDLQLAIKRIEASRSYAKQAKAAWLPALNAQAAASTNNPSQNSLTGISLENFLGTSHIEDYSLATTLSWEVDIWGKIRRQKEAALASYLQTQEAARAVQTSIVQEVSNSYYTLLMLDAQLSIAQKNVSLSDSTVQMMRLQKDAGLVTELAVQQAVAQLQNAQILVPQLEEATILQENALRLLLGDWPGNVIRSTTLDNLPVRDSLPAGVPADLLRLRPDVRASEMALVAANARVGMAQGNMYPSLNITATGGLNALKASDWFTMPASLFGVVSGSLTQPIFQRRMLKTQLEVARVEREERVIEFRQSVIRAAHEVTNSLAKLDKLELQQQIATARVETLDQAVQNAQLLFRSGMADYLEVISAQSRALQAELDEAAILRQRLGARVELYKSLGGGWR
jgi:multidrug efflux system outer membrane protein